MATPGPIVPGDVAYYRFWRRVALVAGVWGVLVLLGLAALIWGGRC